MKKFLVLLVVLLGLSYRFALLSYNNYPVDADEAIVGLMAKHILQGEEIPIFYYGQHYMGSLEAILTSAMFYLFGQSNMTLKFVPLLFSGIHIFLTYLIARQFLSFNFSILAAIFCAFGPLSLIFWSSKTRGGFIELVMLGSLSLYLFLQILSDKKISYYKVLSLGLVLGLGWWVNNQIVFYIFPIALFFLVVALKRKAFIGTFIFGSIGFFLGGLPFWYANIFLEPKWATFKVLFSGTSDAKVFKNLTGLFAESIPMILGAKRFWSENEFFSFSSELAYILLAISILSLFFVEKRKEAMLLLTFVLSTVLIFSFSKFGSLYKAPRYLLPLYSVLPVIYAIFASKTKNRFFCSAFVSLVLALQLLPTIYSKNITLGMPILNHVDRMPRSHQELYEWLEKENYNYIDTNYWIGYRVAFETNEEVKFRIFSEPLTARIKSYEQDSLNHPVVYVLVPSQEASVVSTLKHYGFNFRRTALDKYVIIDKIKATWILGGSLKVANIKSNIKSDDLDLILDNNVDTRWGSAKAQYPGMSIELELEQGSQDVVAVELDLGRFYHDYPRHLKVFGKMKGGDWELLSDIGQKGQVFNYFPDENGRPSRKWLIRFNPRSINEIKLLQVGQDPIFDWSIAELKVYGAKLKL